MRIGDINIKTKSYGDVKIGEPFLCEDVLFIKTDFVGDHVACCAVELSTGKLCDLFFDSDDVIIANVKVVNNDE